MAVWSLEYVWTAASSYVTDAETVTIDGVWTAAYVAHASTVYFGCSSATDETIVARCTAVTLLKWKCVYLVCWFGDVVCEAATTIKRALSCHAAASLTGVYTPTTAAYRAVGRRCTRGRREPAAYGPAVSLFREVLCLLRDEGGNHTLAYVSDGLYVVTVERVRRLVAVDKVIDAAKVVVGAVLKHDVDRSVEVVVHKSSV